MSKENLQKAILGAMVEYEAESDGRRTRSELATRMYRWLKEIDIDRDLDYWELRE